jgi:two-component system, NarL family, sensor histidine kinase DesK
MNGPQLVRRWWVAFVLAWVVVLVVIAVQIVLRHADQPGRVVLAVLGVVVLGGQYLEASLRPEAPLWSRLGRLGAMVIVVAFEIALFPGEGMWWLSQHLVIVAGLVFSPRVASALILALVAGAMGTAWLVSGRADPMMLIELAFGASAIALRQLSFTLDELRHAREQLAHLAVAEERLRFSRDLHDLLGHSLSVIALKSELAGKLLPTRPEAARRQMHEVEQSARDALREVRATVAGYRQPTLQSELDQAPQLLRAAGITPEVDVEADPLPLALDNLLALAVREGVTNVIRHSRARRCRISVRTGPTLASVHVVDDGEPSSAPSARGNGLLGLSERARALQGEVHAGRRADGFELALEVPRSANGAPGEAR